MERKKWEGLNFKNLSASSLDSSLIGPTLQRISSFTLPTGPTGFESAFRAFKSTDQSVTANTLSIVTFETTQFDLNGEYDGVSTFIPQQDGVYLIITTIIF
ncbi:hypothetical protein COA05_27645 [Bacillus thuringiensis]|uniref:exosporium leader peptide-containing protein n=1 Tax=Bacillus cereus group TaxID=86661 RepID=UPI000BF6E30E|nr:MULTISPECIES: exosporium leader peptide-containing protein [Bacillus cereus group]AZV66531.1 hypothetical protein DT426_12945 [Bacillus cereus]MCU4984529.1 hypothetical protein [Bacillus cereus]MCU5347710.1 hypothetical protein [Bacillus cereus]MCU5454696.1 hypothetical protein [Bacillus cereus]MCU5622838.1 hypothetical protein [Bacillus cereus]